MPVASPLEVTVAEVLQLGMPLGTLVVAGQAGLGRAVTWVQVLRGRATGPMNPGDLVIVSATALNLPATKSALARLVQDLFELRIAALALPEPPPEAASKAAETLGLPLLVLPDSVSLAEVERAVVALILDRESRLERRTQQIYDSLLATLMQDRGIAALAEAMLEVTGRTAIVLDEYLQVQAHAAHAGAAPIVSALRKHLARAASRPSAVSPTATRVPWITIRGVSPPQLALIRPLQTQELPAGFLCLVGESEPTPLDLRVADKAASVITIELLKERAVAESRLRLRRDFMDDLLAGTFPSESAMDERAQLIGYDLTRPFVVAAVEPSGPASSAKDRLLDALRAEFLREDPSILLKERDGQLVILRPLTERDDAAAIQWAQGALARARLLELGAVAIGVGRTPDSVAGFALSYREAVLALQVAQRMLGGDRAVHFRDLGVLRLLLQLLDNPELRAFRHDLVGALEAHDLRRRGQLTHTLEIFLACNGNHARASQELHLHRNTLLYRLEKIRSVLGFDLEDAGTRLAVQLALKIRHIDQNLGSGTGGRASSGVTQARGGRTVQLAARSPK